MPEYDVFAPPQPVDRAGAKSLTRFLIRQHRNTPIGVSVVAEMQIHIALPG